MPRTLGSSLVMTFGIRLAPGADAELVTPQLPSQSGPRVLLLPLLGVSLHHGEAGEVLGHEAIESEVVLNNQFALHFLCYTKNMFYQKKNAAFAAPKNHTFMYLLILL